MTYVSDHRSLYLTYTSGPSCIDDPTVQYPTLPWQYNQQSDEMPILITMHQDDVGFPNPSGPHKNLSFTKNNKSTTSHENW